jgi:hypothetical protein
MPGIAPLPEGEAIEMVWTQISGLGMALLLLIDDPKVLRTAQGRQRNVSFGTLTRHKLDSVLTITFHRFGKTIIPILLPN